MQDEANVQCPHCFEVFMIAVDVSGGEEQNFVIDCEICCRPMNIQLTLTPDEAWISADIE